MKGRNLRFVTDPRLPELSLNASLTLIVGTLTFAHVQRGR